MLIQIQIRVQVRSQSPPSPVTVPKEQDSKTGSSGPTVSKTIDAAQIVSKALESNVLENPSFQVMWKNFRARVNSPLTSTPPPNPFSKK